jgi:medium-chain acyl-[acyl-carrier-protein] hydrolase
MSVEKDWVTRWGQGEPERRLFCFPHAGAGGGTFRSWSQHAPDGVEVCAIEAPGRFGRSREEPFRSMDAFIDALDGALHGLLDRPYVIFGHSLGALMAFEWVLRARKLARRMPEQLIVAACEAPSEEPRRALCDLPEERFLEAIERRYGRLEPSLRSDPELLTFVLRVMRADLEMLESYRCSADAVIDAPIFALAGSGDRTVSSRSVKGWAKRTTSTFHLQTFSGGHFFIRERSAEVAASVYRIMRGESLIEPYAGARACAARTSGTSGGGICNASAQSAAHAAPSDRMGSANGLARELNPSSRQFGIEEA